MPKILLEIKDCRECPKNETFRTPNSGFAVDHFCSLKEDDDGNSMKTSGYVEWEEDMNPIPKWCPILYKGKKICPNCNGAGSIGTAWTCPKCRGEKLVDA